MRGGAARRVAFTGLLFALALVLSYAESLVAPLLGLPPGVKLGLANIVVMYALMYVSARQALALAALKAGFALISRGALAGLLSAAGGGLSLAVAALLMLPKKRPVGTALLSVAGALGHNGGQALVVLCLFGPAALYYLPVLGVSGVGTGLVTAGLLRALLPALERAGLSKRE